MSRIRYARIVAVCAAAALAVGACSSATGGRSSSYADRFYTSNTAGSPDSATGADSIPQSVRARIDIHRGRGVVRVGHLKGTYIPPALIQAFEQASGYTVEQVEVPRAVGSARAVDVLVGLDDSELASAMYANIVLPEVADAEHIPGTEAESTPGAFAYGRDDVCVLADRSWFSANNLKLPTSLAEVASGDYASQLIIPAPKNTADGRAFAQLISHRAADNPRGWVTGVTSAGATVDTEVPTWRLWTAHEQVAAHRHADAGGDGAADTQSGAARQSASTAGNGQQGKSLIVAPMSLLASATDNTGAQTVGAAIPGTCVQRTLRAAILAGHSENGGDFAFIDFLTSPAGQEIIAHTGWAYPLGDLSEQTPASWFLTPREDALALPEEATTPQGSETAISHW